MPAPITAAPPSLAAVFTQHWPTYRAAYGDRIPPQHVHAARAIMQCRTAELGSVLYRCKDCGRMEARPISCGHRACNGCGHHKSLEWEARQKARLLPVPYLIQSPPPAPSPFRCAPGLLLRRSLSRGCRRRSAHGHVYDPGGVPQAVPLQPSLML